MGPRAETILAALEMYGTKTMIEHGLEGNPLTLGNTRTLCKCGKEFTDERGLLVHIGRSRKLSGLVSEKSLSKEEKTSK